MQVFKQVIGEIELNNTYKEFIPSNLASKKIPNLSVDYADFEVGEENLYSSSGEPLEILSKNNRYNVTVYGVQYEDGRRETLNENDIFKA